MEPPVKNDAPAGESATCKMDRIARDGPCGKPAVRVWHTKDGAKVPVCASCQLSVMACGGTLGRLEDLNPLNCAECGKPVVLGEILVHGRNSYHLNCLAIKLHGQFTSRII